VYRAALADILVPYGDPRPAYFRGNAFDVGEYGIGMLANSLELGCDCLGEIHHLDVAGHDSRGQTMTIPNAICMHEEDNGWIALGIVVMTPLAVGTGSSAVVYSTSKPWRAASCAKACARWVLISSRECPPGKNVAAQWAAGVSISSPAIQ
jgi:hypothetical protein